MTSNAPPDLDGFELSPQQTRLWRAQRGAPTLARLVLASSAPFDASQLQASLRAVLARHEILRTRYPRLPGMALPVQAIGDAADPFDTLGLQLSVEGPRATLQLPALQTDTASLHRLAEAWAAAHLGELPDEPTLQYADYAAWRSEGSDEASQRFWETEFATAAPAPALPLGRGRPAPAQAVATAVHAVPIDDRTRAVWHRAAAQWQCPASVLALAAWITLWQRHAEAERLTLGFESQHRSASLADAIGLFAEPLTLTLDSLDRLTFGELCQQLIRRCATLSEWRDGLPLDGVPPLASGFRELPPAPGRALQAAGWHVVEACGPATVPLLLEHHEGSDTPLWLLHDPASYCAQQVALLADQFATLLAHGCETPDRPLAQLSATSDAEMARLVGELAASPPLSETQQRLYERIATLPHLAAALAETPPEDPAVAGSSGTLSAAELHRRADALAQHLLARGLTAGAAVAHCLPRDLDALVGLLAILKAGACYVPVDPDYPEERIAHLLEDSQAALVLIHRALLARLPQAWQTRTLVLDEPLPPLAGAPAAPVIAREQPAYLIYTSGSTGVPKGVVITHANALHSLAARLACYPQPVRRFLLLSSLSFDSSIAGLFWSLAQGGCLHVASTEQQKDPAALATLVRTHGVTHLLALPSLHALLLERLGVEPSPLNTVIVAGEACQPSLVAQHHRLQPQSRLYNEYGPTEASVWSTVTECAPGDAERPVPIGRAIAHTRVYLLDAQGTPVARGLQGELCIAGPGLSPGYLRREALTAEKFVTAQHPALRSERLYRTGDWAAFGDDDRLLFLGRADAQVKLRGHRIELGEIEAALCATTGASQAVVLLDATQGEPRLRAFVELPRTLDADAAQQALARRLPGYMVPAEINALPALPRTANGKVDARALLAMAGSTRRAPYDAPRGHVEGTIAALWEELLGQRAIGRDDDFFALGGHSLLVVKLVHRLRSALQVDLPVSAVFQHPTLAQLAERIGGVAGGPVVALRAGRAEGPPLFCLHRPAGDVLHYAPLLQALPEGLAVHGLVLPEGLGARNAPLAELAARYADALRAVQPAGPYRLCGWSMGGLLAVELAKRLEADGERVELLALFDTTFEADDDALPFDRLLEVVADELTGDGRTRLTALPSAAVEALRAATAGMDRVEQLRHALIDWPAQHGLPLAAPQPYVAAQLDAMAAARQWLQGYVPPKVQAPLQLWWAERTLAERPTLPTGWDAIAARTEHRRAAGDHDSMLSDPDFQQAFAAQFS